MGGRKWTDEELVLLEELTEKYPLETVARRLNRTKEAVFLKRQRIGMGGYMANTDMLTRNTVSKILWNRKPNPAVLGEKRSKKLPEATIRDVPTGRYHQIHERAPRGLERSQGNRRHNVYALQLVQGKKKK